MSWAAWDPAPLVLAPAALALWRFWHGFLRLRRRGRHDHAGWDRAVLFTVGVALATLPLVSPLDERADHLLSVHMLQHVLVGDLAPALLVVSLRGPLLAFVLPIPLGGLVARIERLPVWASLAAWAAAVGAWHVPAVYDAALVHPFVHDAEHASFVAAGLLVWTQLVDPARRRRLSTGQRLAFAGGLFACGQLLSDVLLLAGPLYPAYGSVSDQQLAGLVMMVEQTTALGVFAALMLRPALRSKAALATPSGGGPGSARAAVLNNSR
jgi:cytochrome c oxidase assembly factor CtaG